jgi:hypothetical protein
VDFGGSMGIIQPVGKEAVTRLSSSPPGHRQVTCNLELIPLRRR